MSEYKPRLGARETDEPAIAGARPSDVVSGAPADTIEVSVVMPCLNEADRQ